MKEILDNYDIINTMDIDPDTLGGDFEIPEDLLEYEEDTNISMAVAATNIGGGLTIVDNLTTVNYSNRKNSKEFIVIHFTAGSVDNGSAAKANTNYFKSTNRGASAQLFVDMNPIIYRCVPDDLIAWHCGTKGTYYHPKCRNSNSIGIEICSYKENGVYKFKDITIQNAIKLTRYLAKKYNIPRSNILMHWHVTHKICAAPFITNGKPNERWNNFLDEVFGEDKYAPIDVVELKKIGKVINLGNDTLNYRSGPGTNYAIIGKFKQGDILNITSLSGEWYGVDNKGFVHKNYIKLMDNLCDEVRDELLNNNIITDKEQWSKYSDYVTKGMAIQLVSNVVKDNIKQPYEKCTHWASKALNNLISKKIITDQSQWENKLDEPISIALYMALVCNCVGGILDIYKNQTYHWGKKCLNTLCDKELIFYPMEWANFEGQVQKDKAMALIYNLWTKYFK